MVTRQELLQGFAARFNEALDDLDVIKGDGRQAEVARMFRVRPPAARKWLLAEGLPEVTKIPHIASRLNVHFSWLLYGIGPKRDGLESKPSPFDDHNVEDGPDIRGLVPLISCVQAGEWSEIVDNFEPGDAEMWLPCPVPHGPHTFVLRVRGPSMTAPYGPSFADGELIFVDPDVAATNGKFVVARLDDQKKATFKKLVIQGDDVYLEALNPDWPERIIRVNERATICGVTIFKGTPV